MTNHTNEPFTASMYGTAADAKRAEDEYYEQRAREPAAFAVELADGTIGLLGWQDMSKFDAHQRMTVLRDGCRYVFAYRGDAPPAPRSDDAPREVAQEPVTALAEDAPTFNAPPEGFTCFHCGSHFASTPKGIRAAREHFGETPSAPAKCVVVPRDLPFEVLGDAAIAGVFETGNPKHGWDYLLAKVGRPLAGPAPQQREVSLASKKRGT